MATLEEIRAKLLAQTQKNDNNNNRTGGDNAVYPFWNTPEGGSTLLRFLPDGDPNNTFFWAERLVIKLPFQGIKGDHDREVVVQVPCMEMYGETCPILAETRPWWKGDETMQNLARKYWKKKSYIFQGFVVKSDFEEKEVPENPIRRFIINPSIFEIIKSSLMDPEMEDLPTDFISGRDFKLVKTTKGGFANYGTSSWSMRTRSLSQDEAQAIDTHGLNNLKDFLPKKPTAEELEVIKEMFAASVNDEAYDPDRWSNYFRPSGFSGRGDNSAPKASAPASTVNAFSAFSNSAAAASAPAPTPAPVAPAAPVAPVETSSVSPDVSEILRRVKDRQLNGGN